MVLICSQDGATYFYVGNRILMILYFKERLHPVRFEMSLNDHQFEYLWEKLFVNHSCVLTL